MRHDFPESARSESAGIFRSAESVVVRINPRRILGALLTAITVLVVTSIVVAIGVRLAGTGKKLELMTSVDSEASVPTAYAMVQLAACAAAALGAALAIRARRQAGWQLWGVLSAMLALVALDEVVQVHEYLNDAVMKRIDTDFQFPWLVGGLVLFVAVVVGFGRMGAHLPPPVGALLLAGFALFLSGAVAMDSLSGFAHERGSGFALMLLLITVEETLELVGAAVVAYAIARFFAGHVVPVSVTGQDGR